MDAIHGTADIERAGAHRVARAASHEAWQVGLALNHFGRRRPVRPLCLADDLFQPGPLETFASDPDTIANRATVGLNEIKKSFGGVNDDGAGRFGCAIENCLTPVFGRQVLLLGGWHYAGSVI